MIKSNNSYRGYLLFLLIVIFFTVALSLFLLLIQGKKLSPQGGIIETGVIRLLSDVGDIKVYLNGKEISRSNNLIQNVPLGKNIILVQKAGYSDWEKVIKVDNTRVLEITARLYPEDLNLKQVSSLNINTFAYSADLSNMYFTVISSEDPEENGLWRIDLSNGLFGFNNDYNPQRVFAFSPELLEVLNSNSHELNISENGSSLILTVSDSEAYYWSTSNSNELIDLHRQMGYVPSAMELFRSDSILVYNDNILFERDISSAKDHLVTYQPNGEIKYCSGNGFSFWLDGVEQDLYKYENNNSIEISTDRIKNTISSIQNLYCLNSNTQIILQNENELFFVDLATGYIDSIAKDVTIESISNDGTTVMYRDVAAWYTYLIKYTSGSESPVTENKLLESIPYNYEAYIADTGSTLGIINNIVENRNTFLLADIDGDNVNIILDDVSIQDGQNFMLQSNRKKLFIVLEDKVEGESELQTQNILYEIDLTR